MNDGGFFAGKAKLHHTPETEDPNRDVKRYPAILWGEIVTQPRIVASTSMKVEFTVKFGPSRNAGNINTELTGYRMCEAWGKTAVTTVMQACKYKETVLCLGEWKIVKYAAGVKNRKGVQKKDYHIFKVQAIYPMGLLDFLAKLYNSRAIRDILEAEDNEAPDPFESMESNISQLT